MSKEDSTPWTRDPQKFDTQQQGISQSSSRDSGVSWNQARETTDRERTSQATSRVLTRSPILEDDESRTAVKTHSKHEGQEHNTQHRLLDNNLPKSDKSQPNSERSQQRTIPAIMQTADDGSSSTFQSESDAKSPIKDAQDQRVSQIDRNLHRPSNSLQTENTGIVIAPFDHLWHPEFQPSQVSTPSVDSQHLLEHIDQANGTKTVKLNHQSANITQAANPDSEENDQAQTNENGSKAQHAKANSSQTNVDGQQKISLKSEEMHTESGPVKVRRDVPTESSNDFTARKGISSNSQEEIISSNSQKEANSMGAWRGSHDRYDEAFGSSSKLGGSVYAKNRRNARLKNWALANDRESLEQWPVENVYCESGEVFPREQDRKLYSSRCEARRSNMH